MRSEDKKRFAVIWVVLALFVFLAFYFDSLISIYISYARMAPLTDFFMGITFVSSLLIVFLFLTAIFMKEGKRKWVPPLWISLAISIVISFILKATLQRDRPYQEGIVPLVSQTVEASTSALVSASHATWNSSFPSFQAMMVFAVLPFLQKEFPKFKWVWLVFACLVALSRVYLGVHFMSDVLLGGIMGYVIGFFVLRWWKEKFSL